MKRIILLVFCLVALQNLQAQYRLSEKGSGLLHLEKHQVTFNLLGPGFRYEIGLLRNVTASTSFSPGLATYQEGYTFGYAWHTRIRYYHNVQRRLDANKNVVGNSANYLAPARSIFWGKLQLSQNMAPDRDFAVAFYGGVYGIQRTNQKGFNYTIEAGYGYYRGDGVLDGHGPMLNFTFGWVATKRKKQQVNFGASN